jgi:hypothetical protein
MDGDANGVFRNDGGRFTDVAKEWGLEWGGRAPAERTNGTVRHCVEDVNGDGRLDLFFANYGPAGLFLAPDRSRAGTSWTDGGAAWGIEVDGRYDTCAFADFDHDGRLDLYVNGTVTGGTSYRDHLFRHTGTAFEDVTPDNIRALQADHGVQWADVDGDGDEDLALTGSRPDGMHSLLRNGLPPADAKRSLRVRVTDDRGRAIRAGAEVRIFEAGSRRLLGMRLVDTGSGYDAQNDMAVHVGLPTARPVDVEVTWPAAGRRSTATRRRVSPAGQVISIAVR